MAEHRLRRSPRSTPSAPGLVIFMATVLILGSGCKTTEYPSLTCGLWKTDTLRNFNEPAQQPNTRFFSSNNPRDILVTYDEISENDVGVRRRAFYFRQNFDKLIARRKPRFVNPGTADALTPLPVITDAPGVAAQAPNASVPIRLSADGHHFSIYGIDSRDAVDVELPTYETAGGNAVKVLLTPAAVAGDTAVVAAVVTYLACFSIVHGEWCP